MYQKKMSESCGEGGGVEGVRLLFFFFVEFSFEENKLMFFFFLFFFEPRYMFTFATGECRNLQIMLVLTEKLMRLEQCAPMIRGYASSGGGNLSSIQNFISPSKFFCDALVFSTHTHTYNRQRRQKGERGKASKICFKKKTHTQQKFRSHS